MTKEELKGKIIEVLKKEKIGITITRLSQILGVSRPTMYKYLGMLEDEKAVEEIDVGGSKFWTSTSGKSTSPFSKVMVPFRYFLDILLETIDDIPHEKTSQYWKKIGCKMADTIALENLFETEEFYQILTKQELLPVTFGGKFDPIKESKSNANHLRLIKLFSPFFEKIFQLLFAFLDQCEIEKPFELDDPPFLIIRLNQFRFLNDDRLMNVTVGIVESIINDLFHGLDVEITQTSNLKEKSVVLKIHFFVDQK